MSPDAQRRPADPGHRESQDGIVLARAATGEDPALVIAGGPPGHHAAGPGRLLTDPLRDRPRTHRQLQTSASVSVLIDFLPDARRSSP